MTRGAPGPTFDVQVIGAGVAGLCCAIALADAGRRVELIHDGRADASRIAAGMIAAGSEALLDNVGPDTALLWSDAAALWPALAQRAGIALSHAGALHLASPDILDAREARARALGVPVDRAEAGALAVPDDLHLDTGIALGALEKLAQTLGVVVRQRRVAAEETGLSAVRILAAGWGAAGLAEVAPELSALRPIRGQLMQISAPGAGGPVLRGPDVYLVPQPWGWAVGGTMELGRSDLDPDASSADALLAAAAALRPELARAPAQARVAVRAAMADGAPLVGPSRTPGVILATGLRRNGWLLAPLVARLVAAYHEGDPGAVLGGRPAAAWSPARVLDSAQGAA